MSVSFRNPTWGGKEFVFVLAAIQIFTVSRVRATYKWNVDTSVVTKRVH